MINPLINPLFPSLPVTVWALGGPYEGVALLDTGFEGDIIIPAHLGTGLSGPGQDLVLADTRHSCESRNPADFGPFRTTLEKRHWIPAFAGMTVALNRKAQLRLKRDCLDA